jgi:nucleoside-diphosphate kinase
MPEACNQRPNTWNPEPLNLEPITIDPTLRKERDWRVSRGIIGEVIKRLESNDFKIVAMKMLHLTKKQAEGFYAVHLGKPFFESLTDFMSSGPAVVMILEGENVIDRYRELMGATNYKDAAEGTIRKEFATDIEKNVVHGSDASETAAFEMAYFFNNLEIIS